MRWAGGRPDPAHHSPPGGGGLWEEGEGLPPGGYYAVPLSVGPATIVLPQLQPSPYRLACRPAIRRYLLLGHSFWLYFDPFCFIFRLPIFRLFLLSSSSLDFLISHLYLIFSLQATFSYTQEGGGGGVQEDVVPAQIGRLHTASCQEKASLPVRLLFSNCPTDWTALSYDLQEAFMLSSGLQKGSVGTQFQWRFYCFLYHSCFGEKLLLSAYLEYLVSDINLRIILIQDRTKILILPIILQFTYSVLSNLPLWEDSSHQLRS
jgi:hypothetical protein